MNDCCRKLLSEGLDLCVRARKLDAMVRTMAVQDHTPDLERMAERWNAQLPDQPIMSRSATIPLWVQDQYETDLADWERRSRAHLMQDHPA
jgi:hypothetical protein